MYYLVATRKGKETNQHYSTSVDHKPKIKTGSQALLMHMPLRTDHRDNVCIYCTLGKSNESR